MRTERAPVTGIDMSVRRIDEAERVAAMLVEGIVSQGIDVDRLVLGIHRVLGDDTPGSTGSHFAFSLSVGDTTEEQAWRYARRACSSLSSVYAPSGGAADPTLVLRGRREGPAGRAAGARAAAQAQVNRSGGRAVVFRGTPHLVGPLQVHDILERSAIEEVVDITESTPRTHDLVLVSEPVRPRWSFGRLVLYVLPAAGVPDSVYLPFAATSTPEGSGVSARRP